MTLDEVVDQKVKEALVPLFKRIADLEAQVGGFQKEQPFMINGRSVVRRNVAAKRMGVHPSTVGRMFADPMHPLEGVKKGRMLYIYEDTINS